MKKLIPLLYCLPLLLACHSSTNVQQQAEQTIKRYLDSSLHNAKSYQPLKFSKTDTLQSRFYLEPEFLAMQARKDSCDRSLKNIMAHLAQLKTVAEIEASRARYIKTNAAAVQIVKDMTHFSQTYQPNIVGWAVNHQYRVNQSAETGDRVLKTFFLNKDLSRVDSVRQLIEAYRY